MPVRRIIKRQKVDSAKIQRAKDLRRQMTEEERLLWKRLRTHRLAGLHFRRQQIIDGFIVDFYCHTAGFIVEVDGPVHDQQAEYDAERDRILAARDLRILRIRNEEVRRTFRAFWLASWQKPSKREGRTMTRFGWIFPLISFPETPPPSPTTPPVAPMRPPHQTLLAVAFPATDPCPPDGRGGPNPLTPFPEGEGGTDMLPPLQGGIRGGSAFVCSSRFSRSFLSRLSRWPRTSRSPGRSPDFMLDKV